MKIVVCAKYVPDATAVRRFNDDLTVDREGVDGLLSELDEYAVEEALKLRDAADDGQVTVVTVGPEPASAAIRRALQMGADDGVHVIDEAMHGSDAVATSLVLAKVLEQRDFDLVICGMASTDGSMSVVPAMLAEQLGLPQATFAAEVTVEDSMVRIRRDGDTAVETIETELPAVVSVTDQINDPRYPSFKGIMAAKKKPVETYALADLGIESDDVGLNRAWTSVEAIEARPPRSAGTIVAAEDDGAGKLIAFLAERKFV
jgi:electron transfer flavoprotein beta subunit